MTPPQRLIIKMPCPDEWDNLMLAIFLSARNGEGSNAATQHFPAEGSGTDSLQRREECELQNQANIERTEGYSDDERGVSSESESDNTPENKKSHVEATSVSLNQQSDASASESSTQDAEDPFRQDEDSEENDASSSGSVTGVDEETPQQEEDSEESDASSSGSIGQPAEDIPQQEEDSKESEAPSTPQDRVFGLNDAFETHEVGNDINVVNDVENFVPQEVIDEAFQPATNNPEVHTPESSNNVPVPSTSVPAPVVPGTFPYSPESAAVDSDDQPLNDGLDWELAASLSMPFLEPDYRVDTPKLIQKCKASQNLDFEDEIFNPFVVAEIRAEEERLNRLYTEHEHRFLGRMIQPWPLTRPGRIAGPKRDEFIDIPCIHEKARDGFFRIQVAELLYQLNNPFAEYSKKIEDQQNGKYSPWITFTPPPIPPTVFSKTTEGVPLLVTPLVWHFILQNIGDDWRPCFQKTWERYMPRRNEPNWQICEMCNPVGVSDRCFYTLEGVETGFIQEEGLQGAVLSGGEWEGYW